jgi:catechol 2,3-dioxygenase-like lactoylglutathione lyase family enzyme
MRVRRLNHASVRVGDLARSRAFYEGLLALRTGPRPESGPHFALEVESNVVELCEAR